MQLLDKDTNKRNFNFYFGIIRNYSTQTCNDNKTTWNAKKAVVKREGSY